MGQIGPELLGRLFDQHAAALVLYARQWCGAPDDVVQEAFVQLARQQRLPEHTAAWLFTVVRNRAITAGRSAGRRKKHEGVAAIGRSWFIEKPEAAIDGQAAVAALETLVPEEREIVVGRLWGGLTFAQIGQLIGVTDSSAQRRYVAALENLRKNLQAGHLKK